MHVLIFLLLALAVFLYITFRLWRAPGQRRYLYFFLIIDVWLGAVLLYLLFSAVFD